MIAINCVREIGQSLLDNIRNYIGIRAKKNEVCISWETVQARRLIRLSDHLTDARRKLVGCYETRQT